MSILSLSMKKAKSMHEYTRYVSTASAEILYWMTVLIIIIATLILSIILIPLILVLDPLPLYSLVLLLGVTFGSVFALLIRDIRGLKIHHHILALLFLPSLSVINLLIVVTLATKAASVLAIPLAVDPIIIAVVYCCALLLPYFLTKKRAKL